MSTNIPHQSLSEGATVTYEFQAFIILDSIFDNSFLFHMLSKTISLKLITVVLQSFPVTTSYSNGWHRKLFYHATSNQS